MKSSDYFSPNPSPGLVNIKQLLALVLCSLLLTSCSHHKSGIQVIDLMGPVSREAFKLSDIATDIEYVALEATPDSYIQQIRSFSVSDDHILIWDHFANHEQVLLFNRQGIFLRNISRQGKGPGEFNNLTQVNFSNDKKSILMLTGNLFYRFGMDGNLLKTIKLDNFPSSIVQIGNQYLVTYSYPLNIKNNNYSFNLIDQDGSIVQQLFHLSESSFNTNENLRIYGPYPFHDTLSFYTRRMDTIFGIDRNLRIQPRFVFRQSNYTVEEQSPGLPEHLPASLVVLNFREMEDHFFIMGLKGNLIQFLIYSKLDRTIWKLKGYGISNDIDGGPDINPDRATKDYIYCEEPPWTFLNLPADSMRASLPVKYPEKQEAYRKFRSTITDESNPVLMIVKLQTSNRSR